LTVFGGFLINLMQEDLCKAHLCHHEHTRKPHEILHCIQNDTLRVINSNDSGTF